jgi:hypothetical protein
MSFGRGKFGKLGIGGFSMPFGTAERDRQARKKRAEERERQRKLDNPRADDHEKHAEAAREYIPPREIQDTYETLIAHKPVIEAQRGTGDIKVDLKVDTSQIDEQFEKIAKRPSIWQRLWKFITARTKEYEGL